MNKLDLAYQALLQDILDNGVEKKDRTGTGTISVFGRQIRHKMSDGFPLITTKKMHFKSIVTELLWFLRGDTNIKYLVDNGCHIWDGDAYKNYLVHTISGVNNGFDKIKGYLDNCLVEFNGEYEHFNNPSFQYGYRPYTQEEFINKIKTDDEFAKKWGELGPVYGRMWRAFDEDAGGIDQIANLINDLKINPDSRRLLVTAWNPTYLPHQVLPPCHYGFQVYTRELSLEERLCIADKFNPLIREDCLTKTHHPDETEELKLQYRHEWLDSLGPNVVPQRRAISLMWNQRSVDTFLGLPFNIASYGLLLEIIAKEVNMVPDELIGNLGDVHLYSNHVEQAKEQIGRKLTVEERMDWWFKNRKPNRDVCDDVDTYSRYVKGVYFDSIGVPKTTREPYPLPTVTLPSCLQPGSGNWDKLVFEDFYLNNYQSHPAIKAPLSN